MKKSLTLLFLLFSSYMIDAQTTMNLDSLLSLLPSASQDSNAVDLYINIGQQYETNKPEIAKQYYLKAGELSRKLDYPPGYCKYAANYTAVLNMQGKYDSSLAINFEALKVAEEWNDKMWITKMYFNIGNCYNYKLQYETALSYYLKVVPYFEEIDNKPYLALIYDVMQVLFQNLREYQKSIVYGEKAMALFSGDLNSNARGVALQNLSISYLYTTPPKLDKSMNGFQEVLKIARNNQNLYLEGTTYLNMADFYYRMNEMEKARPYYEQALDLSQKIGDIESICVATRGLSYYELYSDNFQEAERLIREVLALAIKNNFLKEKQEAYSSLSELALTRHNYKEYKQYMEQKDSITTIIMNDELLRRTQDIESKYETEKKQDQILLLQKDKKIQFIYIVGLLAATLFLFILGIFYFRNQKRKRQLVEQDAKLKAQRISELEKEKQLTATQALLEGEEAERKRLARDLHDGLGGMLSVIKLKLLNMKGNVILNEDDVPVFHHALEMLDGSIRELRRVAHNLMPESLMRYGLKAALSDFCGGIEPVKLHYFGDDRRIDEKYEVAVFRITQELVNNALKHSKATQINVQVILENNRVNLVVHDNGIGFDPEKIKTQNTNGLGSIRSRVESLNGELELFSLPGKGVEVQVNFLL